jgi:hypothetical protein
MIRRLSAMCGVLIAMASLIGCGSDSVAGKTTTTGNGGGLVALGPDGSALTGCVVLAARSWDPVHGLPGTVDTLRSSASGNIPLPQETYAFLEIQDSERTLGAWTKSVFVPEGSHRTIVLDTMRPIAGRWADRAGIASGRLFLDSSFRSTTLPNADGSFTFGKVPTGDYAMVLDADAKPLRPMGSVHLEARDVRYRGSGNILLTGDTTGSPLWIDDFESGSVLPLLHRSVPTASAWYVWASLATMTLPNLSQSDSILQAIGPDSTRPGRSFHSRFVTQDPYAWVALGIVGMEIDLSARSQLCFSYRSDTLLKIQFQRDSVGAVRPTLSSTIPSARQWRDVCVATSGFVPNSDTPDSLKVWGAFGRRVLVLEFQTPSGGTFLDIDDIRLR